jgi:pantoate--beta-alanine ligase
MTRIIDSPQDMQQLASAWRRAGEGIAFVPTMGKLHAGHLSLIAAAQQLAPRTVVSLFVNPLQFAPHEDFASYPRSFEADVSQLEARGVDGIFAPSVEAMYPAGKAACSRIEVPEISEVLEGEHRPGFFSGVATVVCKLFNLVQPTHAVFGEKDFQQCLVVKQLVRDLNLPVDIHTRPTLRDTDGLALSSRNIYLDAQNRVTAAKLYVCLQHLVNAVQQSTDANFAVIHASQELEAQGFIVDYVVVRRQADLRVPTAGDNTLVALAAVRLGSTRLIDNIPFKRMA